MIESCIVIFVPSPTVSVFHHLKSIHRLLMYFSCCQILFFSFWDLTLDSIFCVSDLLPLSMVYQHSQPHISLIMFSHNNLIVAICFQNSFVPSFLQTYQLKTTVKLSWQTQMQIHMSMIPPLLFFFFLCVVYCFSSTLTTNLETVFVWVLGNGQGVEMSQLLLYSLWKHNGKKKNGLSLQRGNGALLSLFSWSIYVA